MVAASNIHPNPEDKLQAAFPHAECSDTYMCWWQQPKESMYNLSFLMQIYHAISCTIEDAHPAHFQLQLSMLGCIQLVRVFDSFLVKNLCQWNCHQAQAMIPEFVVP